MNYQPKGGMCAVCVNKKNDCSKLPFKAMQVIKKTDNESIVKCEQFSKELAAVYGYWLTTTPPKDGTQFIADVGFPWAVVAAWNECENKFVWASFCAQEVKDRGNDPWFENEYEEEKHVKGWMPMPEVKPRKVCEGRKKA